MPETYIRKCFCATTLCALALGVSSCTSEAEEPEAAQALPSASVAQATPRFDDGTVKFDRVPGSKGYWSAPSLPSLVEEGVEVVMDEDGHLEDINEAAKVAPFKPWALALYRYRQETRSRDDPVNVCISPAGPRHFHAAGGFRIIQDRNYNRVYALFGGGNRGWRVIFMDGRSPPDPEEVYGTYYGHSVGHWEDDTLVVQSSGFNERFWFSNGGLPHTEALQLTERFSRPDYDTLRYEVRVDDPNAYERPWTSAWTLQWMENDEIETRFCEDSR